MAETTSKVANRTFMIDTIGLGNANTVAVYVVKGAKKTAVIDCGYASSFENVLRGLGRLGVEPSSVHYLIPTHVHLDHAGAAGHLVKQMPKAKVIAHEKAVRHLVDPTKLVESAAKVFGEDQIRRYGSPLPVENERISAVGEESHIDLGGATLTTLHAPGHAPHQISIVFEEEHLLFSADAVGLVFPSMRMMLPATPPPSLDAVKLAETVERLRQTDPKMLLVPHFGVRGDVNKVLDETKETTSRWISDVQKFKDVGMTTDAIVGELTRRIAAETKVSIGGIPSYVKVLIRVNVLGIAHYLERLSGQGQKSP